jgi:hypothetical protein
MRKAVHPRLELAVSKAAWPIDDRGLRGVQLRRTAQEVIH